MPQLSLLSHTSAVKALCMGVLDDLSATLWLFFGGYCTSDPQDWFVVFAMWLQRFSRVLSRQESNMFSIILSRGSVCVVFLVGFLFFQNFIINSESKSYFPLKRYRFLTAFGVNFWRQNNLSCFFSLFHLGNLKFHCLHLTKKQEQVFLWENLYKTFCIKREKN